MTKQRMYNVVVVREDNGNFTQMNATPMNHHEACTFMSKLTKHPKRRNMLVEVAVKATQVPAQPVYTLELAVGEDVAHKEYRDYTLAKQAYDDAVSDELALTLTGVTRVELFSEAVGSMGKWVRGEPALANPVPPAGGEPVVYALSCYNDVGGYAPKMVPRGTLPQPETRDGYVLEDDHRAHVTRLQAEAERLKEVAHGFISEIETKDKALTSANADKAAYAQNAIDLRLQLDASQDEVKRLKETVQLKDRDHLEAQRVVTHVSKQRDALQSELAKADNSNKVLREQNDALGELIEKQNAELAWAQELLSIGKGYLRADGHATISTQIDYFLSNQSAPADKVCEHNRQVYNVREDRHTCIDCNAHGPFPAKGIQP